jgi:hypothetical protein
MPVVKNGRIDPLLNSELMQQALALLLFQSRTTYHATIRYLFYHCPVTQISRELHMGEDAIYRHIATGKKAIRSYFEEMRADYLARIEALEEQVEEMLSEREQTELDSKFPFVDPVKALSGESR